MKRNALFLIILFSCGSGCLFSRPQKPAALTAYDSIAVPGEKFILRAKIEKKVSLFRPDVKYEAIVFYVDGKKAGEAVSGCGGFACLPYVIDKPGISELTVDVSTSSKFFSAAASPAHAKIFCSDKKRPAVIVDIDHTVADVSWLGYIVKPNSKVKPLKNSPEVLQRISKKYGIIFVTKREDAFIRKTGEWLEMYEFPVAPVFFWDFGNCPVNSAKYKTERIKELKKIWKNISIGIGDRDSDIKAYLGNKMKVIKIGRSDRIIPDVTFVSDWDEIENLLTGK